MRYILLSIFCIFSLIRIYAVSSIGGVVNQYYEVQNVYNIYLETPLTENLSTLKAGDKIVLIQMSGIEVDSTPGFENSVQYYNLLHNAGRYYLLSVKSVNNVTKRVDFTVAIDPTVFTNGEKIQMVKIYEDDYVSVTSTLTASNWNGKTGGILAMVVYKKLTLNADIDVSGKGFRGADPEGGFGGSCSTDAIYYYNSSSSGLAGRKGEGNVQKPWHYTKGPGPMVIGGGGGIGKFAGGGGGGNFGNGGSGGYQMTGCLTNAPTYGGIRLHTSDNFYALERIILGGGGGSSTYDGTHAATKGGNGGGIVIIISDTIEINSSKRIISNGEAVTTSATAGGGGGGAGGSIFLDINYYKNLLGVSLNGGKGGNTNTGTDTTGAGGGGGGGLLRFAGSTFPNISATYTPGAGGTAKKSFQNGVAGSAGSYLNNLKLPLNGFLFNSITGTDTLCAGQNAQTIKGSNPKGGIGYVYKWLKSTDSITWTLAGGTGIDYSPGVLNNTTWFKRIVNSGLVSDTSLSEKIYVLPVIANNILEIRDTLCYNSSPGILNGNIVTGGSGTYSYQWQSSLNQSVWTNRSATSSLSEGNLTATTYYRRIVTSGIVTSPTLCTSTSNIDTITILPLIGNNNFNRTDTAICQNLNTGTVKANLPTGGDNHYSYNWLISTNGSSYGIIGGATSQTYNPGVLAADRYYKRVVFSGEGDVCKDTSTAFYIQVYPSINSNSISTDSSRYCEGIINLQISGLTPTGGNSPTYSYHWSSKTLHSAWSDISGANSQNYSTVSSFADTSQFVRIVYSGRFDACKDTSNIVRIDIIPVIENLLTTNDTAVCEGALPLPFNETIAGGGAGTGTYQYLWQDSLVSSTWQNAPQDISLNDQPAYSPKNMDNTTWYRRKVVSQICTSYSNHIKIEVYPELQNNVVSGGANQFVCYQSQKTLNGLLPSGGNNSYNYIWQQSDDNSTWNTTGGSTQSLTSAALLIPAYFRRIARSGTHNQCIDTSSVVMVSINTLPTGVITAGIDTVCADENIAVNYTFTGNSPWTVKLGQSGDTIYTQANLNSNTGNITFSIDHSLVIQLLDVMDDSACHATSKEGAYTVAVYQYPEPIAGNNADTCGLIYKLKATNSSADNAYWSWSGSSAAFQSVGDPNTVVTSDGYGEKSFTWNQSNWNCEASDEVTITFYEQPQSIDAGEDQILDYKFETSLNAVAPAVGNGYWSEHDPNSTISDTTLNNSSVILQEVGRHKFTWKVVNGSCEVLEDSVFVTVGELQVFSGFSPNGDGVNDSFVLELSGRNTAELIILDINGGVVFNTAGNEEISWDGANNKGKEVPEGTYFYIIKEPGVSDRKGFIELRR